MGLIPYGEVFGELNGYATISEFLIYMDELGENQTLSSNMRTAPLYVFDNEILQEKFIGDYQLPGAWIA